MTVTPKFTFAVAFHVIRNVIELQMAVYMAAKPKEEDTMSLPTAGL